MSDRLLRRIAFLAYPGVSLLDLAGPMEAFRLAAAHGSDPLWRGDGCIPGPHYECVVLSLAGGPVTSADGLEINTQAVSAFRRKPIDTLIVPGGVSLQEMIDDGALPRWLQRHRGQYRRVCSVCTGAFLLGAAGILEGKRATTHWMFCNTLAQLNPSAEVEADAIFVRDGNVWTSAGFTSGIDLALALIEDDAGRKVALNIARILVVYLKRAGGQSQYSALLGAQASAKPDAFAGLEAWIAENLKADLGVEALAARVNMSPRNFARVYSAQRGRTPAKAVDAIRIDAARRLLEDSLDRVEQIALKCGYSSDEQMRAAFVRTLGVPPSEYRNRFTRGEAR